MTSSEQDVGPLTQWDKVEVSACLKLKLWLNKGFVVQNVTSFTFWTTLTLEFRAVDG